VNEEKPSSINYSKWAKANGEPSYGTLTKFGTWNELRTRASSEPAEVTLLSRGRGYWKKWSEEDCYDAIRRYEDYCRSTNQQASRDGYQEWQKDKDDIPSIGPIENLRLPWNTIRLKACDFPIVLNPSPHPASNSWPEHACQEAIDEFVRYCISNDLIANAYRYELWCHDKEVPKARPIARLYGSWENAINQAKERMNRPSE
jgi:hypothetical protein